MTDERQLLDYASQRPADYWAGRRRALLAGCCFGGSWLCWLLLYKAATFPDGFPDEVFNWGEAIIIMAVPGTLCGLVLFAFALGAMGVYER
jgi:hypothetical protein